MADIVGKRGNAVRSSRPKATVSVQSPSWVLLGWEQSAPQHGLRAEYKIQGLLFLPPKQLGCC